MALPRLGLLGRRRHPAQAYSMAKRPGFGLWLKHTWLDILTMAILGAIGLLVYMLRPVPNRSFAVAYPNGEVVYPQFAYPLRKEVVPIWLAAVLAGVIPIFFFALMQIRVRSFWDFNNAVLGLLYSLITAAVFQVFIKWLIGGLRPHFLDVCQPDPALLQPGNGFRSLYYTREICTGDEKQINDALESFPSGHTTAAFAGFVFLYLYLNAKLKVFSNYHPSLWKLALIYAPILGAVLIGGALTIDKFHNWYDILAGAIIGTIFAFSAYRMTYAAIWDWRYNHIPLSRVAPYDYGVPSVGSAELPTYAVATRKANWGTPDAALGSKEAVNGLGSHSTSAAGVPPVARHGSTVAPPAAPHGSSVAGREAAAPSHPPIGSTGGAFMEPRRPVGAPARDAGNIV
ncbi:lipid phosphate phosphatase 2 [Magnaporthiopsis poae ATCC 64411]|uniref:Lipid phosphate phosphatase 2 n=1 Tax=Magnaporthiopsis poae (strain ATCC 64411 / 73-15) TaxID=644358 RepID=A0A0C4DSS3_MAGP6|nr:lipid phosphate phosphatase 2 [Magnaporthiopsis poae ATCC 64411]